MGTRHSNSSDGYRTQDHPHAYGDKYSPLSNISAIARIIPTRMGTSFALNDTDAINRDHPHAYGDKDFL